MAAAAVAERVAHAVQQRQFEELAKLLDSAELESPNPAVLEEWPRALHALHLLGHIYNKQLTDARFLWKRIPASVKQNNPELEAVWRLLQFYFNRHYQGIWQALQAHQWSQQLMPVIEALAVKTREDLVELIGYAYSTVSPTKVAAICGMTEGEALAACQAQGWQYDPATRLLTITPRAASKEQQDGFSNLAQLSGYMVHLEA